MNNWDDFFWRTLLGLVVYTFTQKDMQEMDDKYYIRATMIMLDVWEGVAEFTRVLNAKKSYYEKNPGILEMPLPVACRWDQIFVKLLLSVLEDEMMRDIPDCLQSEDYVRITYDILKTAHSRVQIIDSEANEVARLRKEITAPMPLVNYDRPVESSEMSQVPAYWKYIDRLLRDFETINKAPWTGTTPMYVDLMLQNMEGQPWITKLRDWIYEPNGSHARTVVRKEQFWNLAAQVQQAYERERNKETIGAIDGPSDRRSTSSMDVDDGDYDDMADSRRVNALGPH